MSFENFYKFFLLMMVILIVCFIKNNTTTAGCSNIENMTVKIDVRILIAGTGQVL